MTPRACGGGERGSSHRGKAVAEAAAAAAAAAVVGQSTRLCLWERHTPRSRSSLPFAVLTISVVAVAALASSMCPGRLAPAFVAAPRGGAGKWRRGREPSSSRRASAAGATSQTVLDALKEFDGSWQEPFDLLDITDPEVPKKEIRAAFRSIARKEHPDVSERPDAEERFRRISMAYELLMDDGGRAMLLEALERKVDDLEELQEVPATDLDEQLDAWDYRWEEDEFSATIRVIFLAIFIPSMFWIIWWFGEDHD